MINKESLENKIKKLDLAKIQYHIFLCCYQEVAKCCSYQQGLEAWEFLKNRLRELALDNVYRTRANCLRICQDGPIAVVYPQAIWYRNCSPVVLERIIQEHFILGQPVTEYIIHRSSYEKP